MPKIRIKNVQTAQGMVEFALVLPILLLVILGVFAFGHMFFVYSSVVSASREAARWGAAVGTASGGAGALPRYQDCGAIKAAAVRVGAFAGVGGDRVAIDYDTGPGTLVYGHCPVTVGGTTGPEVGLGDRITVTVTVPYRPIVPFINLPSFNLTATSSRTIIKSLPVGDAPTAQPLWPKTTTEISPASGATTPLEVVVGQTLTLTIKVWDDKTPSMSPTGGYVLVNDEAGNVCFLSTNHSVSQLPPSKTGVDCDMVYAHATPVGTVHTITARYVPNGSHFLASASNGYAKVNKAPTQISLLSPLNLTPVAGGTPTMATVVPGTNVDISFKVDVIAPGVQMESPLVIKARINVNGSTYYPFDTYRVGSTSYWTFNPPAGNYVVDVVFDGNDDYQANSTSFSFTAIPNPPTATLAPTVPTSTIPPGSTSVPPTATTPAPNVTPSATSAATPLPASCPQVNAQANKIFTSYGSAFYFEINNPKSNSGGLASTIDRIEVIWPTRYTLMLNEVRFGTAVSTCDISTNCLLTGLTSIPPSAAFTSGFTAAVNSLPVDTNQSTNRQMLLVFNGALPSGDYTVKVHFADAGNRNCQIEVNATR